MKNKQQQTSAAPSREAQNSRHLNVKISDSNFRRLKATAALRGEPIATTVEKILCGEVVVHE